MEWWYCRNCGISVHNSNGFCSEECKIQYNQKRTRRLI